MADPQDDTAPFESVPVEGTGEPLQVPQALFEGAGEPLQVPPVLLEGLVGPLQIPQIPYVEVLDIDFDEQEYDPYEEADYVVMGYEASSSSTPAEHIQLAEECLRVIREAGIVGDRLALQEGDESSLLTLALKELCITAAYDARGFVLSRLYAEVSKAASESKLRRRADGQQALRGMSRVWDVINAKRDGYLLPDSSDKAPTVPIVYYPARGRKPKLSQVGSYGGVICTKADKDAELMLWCQDRLIVILLEGHTPCTLQTAGSADQRRALSGLVGKLRASTIKMYLRHWDCMRGWLLATQSSPWPQDPIVLVDYLHILEEEPCRPTVPQAWFQAISWVFKCAGFEGPGNLAQNPLVQKTVERLTVSLGANLRPILQAARLPCVILAGLEVYLDCKAHPVFKRLHAGALLFRSWATLRFDDQQRIKRNTMRMAGSVLHTFLSSSKTSGPGKRMRQLPVAITTEADLLDTMWLATWLGLMQEHLPLDRDYLMDQSTSDYGKSTDKELKYVQSAALTRQVMAELRVPILVEGKWAESEFCSMPAELLGFFTEHGPRSVVPSITVVIEPDKTKRDMVGRWCPSGSDDYARTHRAVVVELQSKVAKTLKSFGGTKVLCEDDVVERARRFLTERKSFDEISAKAVCNVFKETLDSFSRHLACVTSECNTNDSLPLSTFVPTPPVQISTLENSLKRSRGKVARVGAFMISFDKNRRRACLHRIDGGCFWARTELNDVEMYSQVDPSMYHKRCKFCFKKAETDPASESSSDSD